MARRKLCSVDISVTSDEQVESALESTAGNFENPYKSVFAYSHNSLGCAKDILQGDKASRYDIEIKINLSSNGDVDVLDNCSGMTLGELKGICERVFLSGKKGVKLAGGGAGFGMHAFRSFFREATIKTKTKGGRVLEMTLKREKLHGNEICETDEDFPYESGTWVHLSGFDGGARKQKPVDFKDLCFETNRRYALARRNPRLRLVVLKDWDESTADEGEGGIFEVSRSLRLTDT